MLLYSNAIEDAAAEFGDISSDDYRKLKQGISKGTAKRKLTTSSKAPLRKNSPATKKKKDAAALLRSKTLSGKASESEQKDFLRGLAQRSLNL